MSTGVEQAAPKPRKRAVAYIRVSRPDENPLNQLYAVQKWAEEHGYEITPFYDYAVSGAVDPLERPGFKMMLEYMKANNIRTIVVTELERLTRDVEHYEKIKDLKKVIGWAIEEDIEIISIADYRFTEIVNEIRRTVAEFKSSLPQDARYLKPIFEMVASMLIKIAESLPELRIAIAQAERERVAERTKRALERLKAEGKVYTKPTLIHKLALFRSGKRQYSELTKEDIEEAKQYFIANYVRPYLQGMKARALWRQFQERERPFLEFLKKRVEEELEYRRKLGLPVPKRPNMLSYVTFLRTLTRLGHSEVS